MRFSDELRESEGERCVVTDLRSGKQHSGVIESVHDDGRKVDVRYDDGATLVRVGYGFVTLTEPESS